MALFRFVEATEGRILIDGIDISRVPLADLRSRLSIILRDPVMFKGSIHNNLDPYWHHDDATIWNALRRCCLIGSDAGAIRPMGLEHLDAPVTENGDNLTYEQQKLLAVARALLREDKASTKLI
jgi:ABC-type multidrug transport system fused ATPase/permease subunit